MILVIVIIKYAGLAGLVLFLILTVVEPQNSLGKKVCLISTV
jgi:hypothetical protein